MAKIYYETDIDQDYLKTRQIAILGFGSQGHAHALNLRDSGYRVVIGLPEASKSRRKALAHGFAVKTIAKAVRESGVVMVLIPDEYQREVFEKEIVDNLDEGDMLMFAHGFAVHFSQIQVPSKIDVGLIAPKSPGHIVRREYEAGRGVPGLLAIHQDFSGNALQVALSYGKGIGVARAGIFETSFKEGTETDLFGEQAILCGGITALMKAGFEILVEAGYQAEMAYFECINEMKLIVDLIYEGGFAGMRDSVSNTAEYGDYITQRKLASPELKQAMHAILTDIQSGDFAKNWIAEKESGFPMMKQRRIESNAQPLEQVGRQLRQMMAWNRPGPEGC